MRKCKRIGYFLSLSDGEDHAGENTINVAQQANAKGIKIFSIGVGTEKGGPIPIKSNGVVESYKKDENGEVVISKRSDIILTSISESTDGVYIDGNDTNYLIDKVKDELQKIEKRNLRRKNLLVIRIGFKYFSYLDLF